MRNNDVSLLASAVGGLVVGIFVIFMFDFNPSSNCIIGIISMMFIYCMLRFNTIDRKLDVIQKGDEQ